MKYFRIVPVKDSTQQNKALNFSGKFRVVFRTIFRFEIKTFRGSFVLQTGRPNDVGYCSHSIPISRDMGPLSCHDSTLGLAEQKGSLQQDSVSVLGILDDLRVLWTTRPRTKLVIFLFPLKTVTSLNKEARLLIFHFS